MAITATPEIIVPGADQLSTQSTSLATKVKSITVVDMKTANQAAEYRTAGKAILKQIDDMFDPVIKSAHEQHKKAIALKKQFTDPINANVITPVNSQLTAFERKREQERQAEQRRLQEEARKEQEQRALEEAQHLQAQGQHEAAEQVVQEAIEAPAPVVLVEKEKIEGVSMRSVWKWEIVDLAKIPHNLLVVSKNPANGLNQEISTTGIGALVRSLKKMAEQQIPGIRVWEDKIPV